MIHVTVQAELLGVCKPTAFNIQHLVYVLGCFASHRVHQVLRCGATFVLDAFCQVCSTGGHGGLTDLGAVESTFIYKRLPLIKSPLSIFTFRSKATEVDSKMRMIVVIARTELIRFASSLTASIALTALHEVRFKLVLCCGLAT